MHRSGTSALAGVIARCGAQLPATPMPPTEQNERGYNESLPICEVHDALLQEAGARWDDITGLPDTWFETPAADEWVRRLAETVRTEFPGAGPFVVKDPRLCHLMPLWLRVFEQLEVDPVFALCVRNPVEVALSLNTAHGVSLQRGQLLWLHHALAGERHSRGHARCFIAYDALLEDWRREMQRLGRVQGAPLPRSGERAQAEIDDYLSAQLRHHRLAPHEEREDAIPWVHRAYAWFDGRARGRRPAEATLDRLAADVAEADASYGRGIAEADFRRETALSALASERGALPEHEAEAARLRADLKNEQAALEAQRDETASLRAGLEERRTLEAEAARQSEALEGALAGQRGEIEALQAELAERGAALEALRGDTEAGERTLASLRSDAEAKEAELEEALAAGRHSDGLAGELETRLEERAAEIAARDEHLFQMTDWIKRAIRWAASEVPDDELAPPIELLTERLDQVDPGLVPQLATQALEITQWARRLEQSNARRKDQQASIARLEADLGESERERSALEARSLQEVEAVEGELSQKQQRIEELRSRLDASAEEQRTAGARHKKLDENLQSAEAEKRSVEAKNRELAGVSIEQGHRIESMSTEASRAESRDAERLRELEALRADLIERAFVVEQLAARLRDFEKSSLWRLSRSLRRAVPTPANPGKGGSR